MIERDDRVVDAEDHLRQTPRGIRVVARERQSLEAACDLVADEPDGAAAEPWQTGLRGATVATHVLSKRDDRICRWVRGQPPRAARIAVGVRPRIDRDLAVAEVQRLARRDADEREATHALAAFGGLEEERAAERAQLRERRDRRLEIRETLAHHRHEFCRPLRRDRHTSPFGRLAPHSLKTKRPSFPKSGRGSWCHPNLPARAGLSLHLHGAPAGNGGLPARGTGCRVLPRVLRDPFAPSPRSRLSPVPVRCPRLDGLLVLARTTFGGQCSRKCPILPRLAPTFGREKPLRTVGW